MTKFIRPILSLVAGCMLVSCIEINSSGYSDLSESERRHVRACSSPIDSLRNDGNIYKVNLGQVKGCIARHDKVLVYEYLPFCSGENGRSPLEVKRLCDRRGIALIVVSSVYDGIFPIPASNTFPMLVIDNSVYGTDNYQDYGEQFYKSLTGSDDESRQMSSYHYFHKGRYVRSYDSIRQL